MGLDMWVYKAHKLTTNEVKLINGKTRVEADNIIPYVTIFDTPKDDEERLGLRDIMPFCRTIKVINEYWDVEKIKETVGANKEDDCFIWYIHYLSLDLVDLKVTITEPSGENYVKELININCDDYTLCKEEDAYAVVLEEIAYWRKNYQLREELQDEYAVNGLGGLINCGYHKINNGMMKVLRALDDEGRFKGMRLTNNLFYHEWY